MTNEDEFEKEKLERDMADRLWASHQTEKNWKDKCVKFLKDYKAQILKEANGARNKEFMQFLHDEAEWARGSTNLANQSQAIKRVSEKYLKTHKEKQNPLSGLRPEIIEFAKEMERVMQKHDKSKGDSWKRMEILDLENMLLEEFEEQKLGFAMSGKSDNENIDIANFCMMLWQRTKKKQLSKESKAVKKRK